MSRRLSCSTAELDAAERDWWRRFAEVEEDYCWVQPEWVQSIIRADYVRDIVSRLPRSGTLLELGCGTGWLSVLLASEGAERVAAVDFSAEQISRAIMRAERAGVSDKAQFFCREANCPQLLDERVDALLIHGLLHHLTTTEIRQVVALCNAQLAEQGKVIVIEPVNYRNSSETESSRFKCDLLSDLLNLPSKVVSGLGVPATALEQQVRRTIAERNVGRDFHGPSPKELPFEAEEIPALFSPCFKLYERKPVLAFSHLVAQEILLCALSWPAIVSALGEPLLRHAYSVEQSMFREPVPHPALWIFELFEFRRSPAEGSP